MTLILLVVLSVAVGFLVFGFFVCAMAIGNINPKVEQALKGGINTMQSVMRSHQEIAEIKREIETLKEGGVWKN